MAGKLEQAKYTDDGEEFKNICIFQMRSQICKNQVNIETECCNKVDNINRAPDKVAHIRTGDKPDEQLQGKPGVADTLDIEESIMSISAILVQGPGCGVVGGPDSEVVDDRDSHVRVGLEAEGEDGGADEEYGDDTNTLDEESILIADLLRTLPLQMKKSTARQKCSKSLASSSSTSQQFLVRQNCYTQNNHLRNLT